VHVEHPADQRPLQRRARPLQHVEARARDLHAALKVDDAQRLADLPVRAHREVELLGLALGADDDVLGVGLAGGHALGREVRQLQEELVETALDLRELGIETRDLLLHDVHVFDQRGPLVGILLAPDGLRGGVALVLELVGRGQHLTTAAVERQRLLGELGRGVVKQPLLVDRENLFGTFAENFHVKHGGSSSQPRRWVSILDVRQSGPTWREQRAGREAQAWEARGARSAGTAGPEGSRFGPIGERAEP